MATNRDLLKEAIADAKAVKEMAIANAKTALEEAFTPRLKEMLSAKIQEMDKEDDDSKKMEEEMKYEEDDSKMEEAMEYEEDDSKMEEAMYDEDDSVDEMNLEELLAELEEEEKGEEKVDEGKKSDEDKDDVKEGMYSEDDDDMDDMDMDEEGEPLDLEDMTDEDLKKMIEDVIADMIDSGELEAGEGAEEEGEEMEMSDEEEDVDLTELLKEIEEEMKDEKEEVKEMDDSAKDEKIEKEFADIKESESEIQESETLNEEPLPSGPELAIILSSMAAIIGSGIGFTYLQSYIARKAKEGSENSRKSKRALDGLGSAAGGAVKGGMSKGKFDEQISELQAENESLKTELSEAVKTTNAN